MELTHLLAPIMGTSFYLGFPRELLYNTDPDYIRSVSIFHNTVLCLFSVWTFCSLFSGLIKYGIVVEPAFYMSKPEINNVVYWFYLSKYYEYVDTFIIYAKNKHPIFLQTFASVSATLEAANDVAFLAPLNPTAPADFQPKTCPFELVSVNIVLL